MIRKSAANELELALGMKDSINGTYNLVSKEAKLSKVLSELNSAAELFDEIGKSKYAEAITNIIINLAKK